MAIRNLSGAKTDAESLNASSKLRKILIKAYERIELLQDF